MINVDIDTKRHLDSRLAVLRSACHHELDGNSEKATSF